MVAKVDSIEVDARQDTKPKTKVGAKKDALVNINLDKKI